MQKRRRQNRPSISFHNSESNRIPLPDWLPGLNSDKKEKERLQKVHEKAEEEYLRVLRKDQDRKLASVAAVNFYFERVNRIKW
jgi:hypothetical protein